MTDSQALRAALRDDIDTAEYDENTHVPIDRAVLASLLSDLDRVERERDHWKSAHGRVFEMVWGRDQRCAVLEKALGELAASANGLVDCDVQYHEGEIRIPGNGHGAAIHRVRAVRQALEMAKAALSSSPVVGGGEENRASRGSQDQQCGEQPEPTVEAAAALARPIETAPNATSHMNKVLLFWRTRGWDTGWWDVDEAFADRPKSWRSPECGWRCDGDQCIPVDQDAVTHWMPLPAHPVTEGEG